MPLGWTKVSENEDGPRPLLPPWLQQTLRGLGGALSLRLSPEFVDCCLLVGLSLAP